jgi:hypothetical protein
MVSKEIEISELVGLTMKSVERDGGVIIFKTDSGRFFTMNHFQDCCESVTIESIIGDLNDLVDSPILVAEESISRKWPDGVPYETYTPDSFTWTFYKLATVKGWVDIRWYGESNGYYSESVSIEELT